MHIEHVRFRTVRRCRPADIDVMSQRPSDETCIPTNRVRDIDNVFERVFESFNVPHC